MTQPPTLAERRRALGLTQVELAARLGLHKRTISAWEYGRPDHPAPPWYTLALIGLAVEQHTEKPAL